MTSVALGEHHARPGLRGADRRTDPGGPAADHQHIGIRREERAPRRQLDPGRLLRPL
jgi:hypothetical protein